MRASGRRLSAGALLLLSAALLMSLRPAAPAVVSEGRALAPSLRLERVVRLAEAFAPAKAGTLTCPELAPAPKIDADLSDWPAAQKGTVLALAHPAGPVSLDESVELTEAGAGEPPAAAAPEPTTSEDDLSMTLRAGWDTTALYLAAEIKDDVYLPGTPDDPWGGDSLLISISSLRPAAEADEEAAPPEAESFLITGTAQNPLLLNDQGQALAAENVALAESAGRRTIEARLPWREMPALDPFRDQLLQIAVRLEDRDSPEEIESAAIDTHGDEVALILTSDHSPQPQAHLSLSTASIGAGELLEGDLLVDAPQPVAAVRLGLEIKALPAQQPEGAEPPAPTTSGAIGARSVARISQRLRLEQGVNAFRLSWNSAGQPEGDYQVEASTFGLSGQVLSAAAPFKIAQRESVWQSFDQASRTLGVPAVLAKLRKARAAAPDAPLKFAVLGDLRSGEKIFQQLLAEAVQQGAEFAIVPGDLVSSGQPQEYLRLTKLLAEAPLPVLALPGNHDYVGQGRLYYQRIFRSTNYAFDLGGYRFIMLDSASGRLTTSQLDWLEQKLQTSLPKFVFVHHPPATIPRWAWHAFAEGAERFTQLMEKYRPARVFVSHIHAYDQVTQNGVEYILTGGAGAPLYSQLGVQNMFYHFVLVEADAGGVEDSVVRLTWERQPARRTPAGAK